MIFTYPAICSRNVDRRYLPAAIKTMELYLLHNIAESVSTGSIRFRVVQKYPGGPYSELKLESMNTSVDGDVLFESDPVLLPAVPVPIFSSKMDYPGQPRVDANELAKQIDTNIVGTQKQLEKLQDSKYQEILRRNETIYNEKFGADGNPKWGTPMDDELERVRNDHYTFQNYDKMVSNLTRQLQDLYKQKNQMMPYLKPKDYTPGANIRIDTTMTTDIRPTAMSVEADIQVTKWKLPNPIPQTDDVKQRMIPISVKVIPIFVDVTDISKLLLNDLYTNEFSKVYRMAVRNMTGVLMRWFKPVLHKLYDVILPGNVNIWRDVILSRKGLVDGSTFSSKAFHGKFKKYAASLVILSAGDVRKSEEDLFTDNRKVNKLFNMGWNTFGVMDDVSKNMTFCCQYDNGMCNVVPYNYMFKALAASDLYKDLDDLSKFTSRLTRGLHAPSSVFSHLKESTVKPEVRKVVRESVQYKAASHLRVGKLLQKFMSEGLDKRAQIKNDVFAMAADKTDTPVSKISESDNIADIVKKNQSKFMSDVETKYKTTIPQKGIKTIGQLIDFIDVEGAQ